MSKKRNRKKTTGKMKRPAYFAYGSNLLTKRMVGRVPSAVAGGVARLDGYCLAFQKRGAGSGSRADIEESDGDSVWGVLYTVRGDEIKYLDACEGGYDRIRVKVQTPRGKIEAFTYKARPENILPARTPEWYLDIIVSGARDHGLPDEYVDEIASIPFIPDSHNGG